MKPMNQYSYGSWNYVALGYGYDSGWWKEFFTIVKMISYWAHRSRNGRFDSGTTYGREKIHECFERNVA